MHKENLAQYLAVALSLAIIIGFTHLWVLSY
ncbi:hypothetical protein PUATCC27989T_02788 [Phytobacter ursingii]|jgi:hypothetical protein|uniref:Uncharacterized protein n=1 Tax=Phytobacter diazotrophicus TaxID=395631 RepID=A0ABN6LSW6_9ENTR|nr:hypothetical protein DFO55_108155 [Grimontella sp. AG753]VTP14917.1 hypothetical protein PUATCC27989T_02788 [Phytobacter ursingii]BDD52312.1 hypothetical protein PDTA9734_37990 [Phytobacter diazotrophicus]BEG83241.1 hypothetical protein PDTA9730_36970 [Phytobacter diazotrophicus]BEG89139.1 hypothetical protein PDTA9759_37950 [Phytobacter diazotrophicus]